MEYMPLLSDQACRRTSTFRTCPKYAPWSRGLQHRLASSAHMLSTLSSSGSLLSPMLVSTNRPLIVGSYFDFSMFFGTSVSGSQVKHLYGYLQSSNTSTIRIVVLVFVYCLAIEFTSGCNHVTLLDV
ncbi:unnamed protein product [Brassica rapa]|uniref:Uncharacterized protein n=1 Tax=Brassica campestris TaxID=3711 RepID=A0A8D9HSP5_BRACM|nr:unnamed protein product [Brassica rapa]